MRPMRSAGDSARGGFWLGFAAGAAAMFVFDPTADEGRRTLVRNHARRVLHRGRKHLARIARHAWSEGEGAGMRLVHRHPRSPVDDLALLDRVQSEIYRDPGVPKGAFNVEVVRGEVVLRGQLADRPAIDKVLSSVSAVAGVESVRSLLHVAGTPAPNKEAALEASTSAS